MFVCQLVGLKEFLFGLIFDGNRGCEVGIVDLEYDQVCKSLVGCYGEAASLISEELPSYVVKEHVDQVGLHIAWFLEEVVGVVICSRRSSERQGRMGGPLALLSLVHVPLFGGIVDGDVVACALSSQARESF